MIKGADVDSMDFINTPSLRNTRFAEFLIQKNALDKGGFKGWASKAISYNRLDWENIGDPNTLTLLHP
jgi:hypothetical protein